MTTQTDSTKVTFTQVYQDVKEGLTALGEALKVGAEHVYEVLIKQQFVNSLTWLVIVLIFGIASAIVLKFAFRKDNKVDDESSYRHGDFKESTIALMIIGSALGLASIITFACTAEIVITGFVNPEYGAMKEIMNFVK